MKFSFYIAFRYFFSKNNRNAINIISGISVLVFAFTVAVTIIILSSFNGFTEIVEMQISKLTPDIKIKAKQGKTFDASNINLTGIKGIELISETLEENVLLRSQDKQKIAVLKGVDSLYHKINQADTLVHRGSYFLGDDEILYMVCGYGILYELSLSPEYPLPVTVWVPNNHKINLHNPEASFNDTIMLPAGVIAADAEFDADYALTNINAVRTLTEKKGHVVSALELKVNPDYSVNDVKSNIEQLIGNEYYIQDKYEQNDSVYKVMRSEKLVTFIILFFVILLASFSIIGAVSMLIIEKRDNITTLMSIGASLKKIQHIFLFNGLLIAFTGGIIGLILGGTLSLLQELFGFLKLTEGSFLVEAYPVDIKFLDFISVMLGVLFAGFISTILPVLKMKRSFGKRNS